MQFNIYILTIFKTNLKEKKFVPRHQLVEHCHIVHTLLKAVAIITIVTIVAVIAIVTHRVFYGYGYV